ncbi:EAL domain-containing protein, partial [Aurantimonas sp. A2-1-M11]|uniref:EAL domain-containing protein n=1 Tax=Aurantimonas sp. A2-1-M11 TaxID=3113712 RepID=UPI002F92111C
TKGGDNSLCSAILNVLDERYSAGGVPMLAGGVIGISSYPSHGQDAIGLLRKSSAALLDAEQARQSFAVYDGEKDDTYRSRSRLLPDLQAALDAPGQIALQYQPKIDLVTGACVGVEALARWRHPEHGLIAPGEFIPLAEETALIHPLTQKVLDLALMRAFAWRQAGMLMPVAVNISIR